MVKQLNRLKRREVVAPTTAPDEDIVLLREIRDSLKRNALPGPAGADGPPPSMQRQ